MKSETVPYNKTIGAFWSGHSWSRTLGTEAISGVYNLGILYN